MKAIIHVSRDGRYFVAEDLITGVADQGSTRREAISNLRKGLEERYEILMDLASGSRKTVCLDIEVGRHAKIASSVS